VRKKRENDSMTRKKKKGSGLKRVLLASGCVLMLVLTFFIIKQINRLSDKDAYAYENAGEVDDVAEAFKEQTPVATKTPEKTEPSPTPKLTPTLTPAPTPTPAPTVEFTTQYAHMGEMTEVYAYGKGVAYGLRYPVYEDEAMQAAVRSAAEALLLKELENFSVDGNAECELLIDYEDAAFGQLESVLFRVERNNDGRKEYAAKPWVYNKKKGEAVEAETLFGDRAYTYIAGKVNAALAQAGEQQEIPGDREFFASYLLTAEGAKFFYEIDDKEASVTIPYPELHTYMAVTVGGTVVQETIRVLDPEKPMIALTFDDGPHFQETPRLLEILEKNGVKVTFFVLGDRSMSSEKNIETVKMVADSGNEIASHTYSHKDLATLSGQKLVDEIAKARENIYTLTGDYPTFIRPPYGSYDDEVKACAHAPLITWNLDSKDWSFRNTDMIVQHVLKEAGDGKIVLMHDIHWFTVDAAEILIPELIRRGYQIVTLRELFYYKGVELENGKVYHSSYN